MYTEPVRRGRPHPQHLKPGADNLFVHAGSQLYYADLPNYNTACLAGGILVIQGSKWMVKAGADMLECFDASGLIASKLARVRVHGIDEFVEADGYNTGFRVWADTNAAVTGGMYAGARVRIIDHDFLNPTQPMLVFALVTRADRGVLLSEPIRFAISTAAPNKTGNIDDARVNGHPYGAALRAAAGPIFSRAGNGTVCETFTAEVLSENSSRFIVPQETGLGELVRYLSVDFRRFLDQTYSAYVEDSDFKAKSEFMEAWTAVKPKCRERALVPYGIEHCGAGKYVNRRTLGSPDAGVGLLRAFNVAPFSSFTRGWEPKAGDPPLASWYGNSCAGFLRGAAVYGPPYVERGGLTVFNLHPRPAVGYALDDLALLVPTNVGANYAASHLLNSFTGRGSVTVKGQPTTIEDFISRECGWDASLEWMPKGHPQPAANAAESEFAAWTANMTAAAAESSQRERYRSLLGTELQAHAIDIHDAVREEWKRLVKAKK